MHHTFLFYNIVFQPSLLSVSTHHLFCFNIPQDPSRVLCGRDARKFLIKFDLNTANDGASAKASPFHALMALGKKRLASMANLSKFHVVFSSSTLIRYTPRQGRLRRALVPNR